MLYKLLGGTAEFLSFITFEAQIMLLSVDQMIVASCPL